MIQWDDIKEQVGEWPSFRELFEAGGPHAQILGACVTGSAEYVQQVLAGDVTLANINKMGFTPIWLAVHFGNRAVSELLIGAGVDIHVPADRHPHDYPLHLAAKRGHVDVVALLLERGADVNARTRYGQMHSMAPQKGVTQTLLVYWPKLEPIWKSEGMPIRPRCSARSVHRT